MRIQEILKQLRLNTGKFPREALKSAINQQEEITPQLLKVLRYTIDHIDEVYDEPAFMIHLYAFYLLAQFRETRAYPLIIELFSIPGEITQDITGDFVTEDLGAVLASVFDGDIEPITKLIEKPDANEYVRSAAMHSLVILVKIGRASREDILLYFQKLLRGHLNTDDPFLYAALVDHCIDLYPDIVYDDIKKAYEDDLVDEMFVGSFEYVEKAIEIGKDACLQKLKSDPHSQLIDDTIKEMQGWACFDREPPAPKKIKSSNPVKAVKIGRNEPCPCGSGKKYKKCCLKKDRTVS